MSRQHDITVIAGLSGVGKTYTIELLMRDLNGYAHFSAGTLIKKRMANLDRDRLRELDKNSILANQYLLVEQLKEEFLTLDAKFRVLFDAHMLIDNDQDIIEVPYEIFEQLYPNRLIFLSDKAENIIARREKDTKRTRPARTVAEIIEQQNRSIVLAQEYCRRLSIPYTVIKSGDIAVLAETLTA